MAKHGWKLSRVPSSYYREYPLVFGQKREIVGVGQSDTANTLCRYCFQVHRFLAKKAPGTPVFGHCPCLFRLQMMPCCLSLKPRPFVQPFFGIRRYFQHAHSIPLVGVGKGGAYKLVHGDLPRQHPFGTTLRFTGPVPADSRQ